MATTDKSEFILFDTDLTTRLSILPAANARFYIESCEPGSGELKIPLDSTAASLVTVGMFIGFYYRGSLRGGWFVDNITSGMADASENGERWMSLSGRGGLALLDRDIVQDSGGNGVREFTNAKKGYILKTLIDEAQTAGGLAALTYNVNLATKDTAGNNWTDSENYSFNVGLTLLELLRQFARTGFEYDISFSGGDFLLATYKNGKGADLSETIYFRTGTNCEEVKSDERGEDITNVYKVAWQDGFVQVTDPPSILAYGRRVKYLDAKLAQSSASAITYASAVLANDSEPLKSISVKIYDGIGPRLFIDYNIGDYIMLDVLGVETKYRVLGIQADFNGDDFSDVTVELNNIVYENELKLTRDLDWLKNQWTTAHDAGLLETSFWAAIGSEGDNINASSYNKVVAIGTTLYFGITSATIIGGVAVDNSGMSATFVGGALGIYDTLTGLWDTVGFGAEIGLVRGIEAVGTDIYVAGLDVTPGTTGAGHIRKYDTLTGTISTLDNGLYASWNSDRGDVYALKAIGTLLYVGGGFDKAGGVGGVSVKNLAVWDTVGNTWADVGGGTTAPGVITDRIVTSLATDGTNLYVGGRFTALGGVPCSNIGMWDGANFTALDVGLDNDVYSIATLNGDVIAGGDFTDRLQIFSAGAWSALGGGVNATVYDIQTYLTDIYVSGAFTDVGNYVAVYSGGLWRELGTGLQSNGYGMAFINSDLYIFGAFTEAGDKPANKVAAYFTDFPSLVNYLENASNNFNMGDAIHNAPASAITDADEVPFWEDVSTKLRKITWANIKATLKTYFDTLYVAIQQTAHDAQIAYTSTASVVKFTTSLTFNEDNGEFNVGAPDVNSNSNFRVSAFTGQTFNNLLSWAATAFHKGIRANGTKAAPTVVLDDEELMYYSGAGYDGVTAPGSASSSGRLLFRAAENFDGAGHGTDLEIWTTPVDSVTRTLALTAQSDGNINIAAGKQYRVNGVALGGGDIFGTGVVGQVAEFVTNTKTLQAAKIIGPAVNILTITNSAASTLALAITAGKTLTLTAVDNYNLTVPATGTAALLATANIFTKTQSIVFTETTPANNSAAFLTGRTLNPTVDGEIYYGWDAQHADLASVTFVASALYGLRSVTTANAVSATHYTEVAAAIFNASTAAANTAIVNTLLGMQSTINHNANYTLPSVKNMNLIFNLSTTGGATTTIRNVYSKITNSHASSVITNAYNIQVEIPGGTGAIGTTIGLIINNMGRAGVTNAYGIFLDNQSGAATLNYGIWTSAGINRFGDNLDIVGSANRFQLRVTGFTTQAVATPLVQFTRNDAAAGVSSILRLTALGSLANGDGGSLELRGKSSTTADTAMSMIDYRWIDVTHATRKAALRIYAYDTAARLGIEVEASGTVAKLGFFGATTVIQQTGDIFAGVVNLGLFGSATRKLSGVNHQLPITYIDGTGTAGADNTAQTVKTLTLPANSLTQVGDRIRIRTYWKGDTGTAVTGSTKLGPAAAEVLTSDTTDVGGATLQLNESWLHYIDNTHANIIENEAGALGAVSAVNVAGFTWNASQAIIFTQSAALNNHCVLFAMIVDLFPKGV